MNSSSSMRRILLALPRAIVAGCLLWTATVSFPRAQAAGPVHVIFWFDTEDYLLPADDDATKRLCEMLTARHIRATFKIVGEKARVLEKRGRADVIAALQKHDIGYHANFHSVHPTPSEYLADCGLLDGMEEFVRREGGGAADVRRILGVPVLACYGQPGSSWGPQTIAALPRIGVAPHGVPCYVDEGTHIGLNGQPFWYAGALVVYHMAPNYTRMDLHDPAAVAPAKAEFSAIADRLRQQDSGGLISIFYHPCEWVHREFWDGVNFSRGANPPREDWKPPRQRSPQETEDAFRRFGEYVDHIAATPGVQFVTASDLPGLYPDPIRTEGATESELKSIAANLLQSESSGLNFLTLGHRAFSLADQFELLTLAVSDRISHEPPRFPLAAKTLLGPDAPPPALASNAVISWPAFRDATFDVRNYLETEGRIPPRVFVGPDSFPPAAFLRGLAFVFDHWEKNHAFPSEVVLSPAPELLPARHVAKDTPGFFGGWIIHRAGFRAPKILEVARLQTWTLKPALSVMPVP